MLRILTTFLISIFVTFTLLIGNALAVGEFSKTCYDVEISDSTLTAVCAKADGYTPSETSIDLDEYIGNVDGTLEWNDHKFSLTCGNIGLIGNNRLRAECERADQVNYLGTYINLDEHITNSDGRLEFE
ncbi:MAG: CVNH domain-containing protein [Scytonema sp. PMC 1070.18]|nr:CVNH domain-containing protein [Scytonema sp. PMC 1070.18]